MTLIRNQMAQPLELHFQSRTIVIPPYGESVIEPEEEESQQLLHLIRSGCCSSTEVTATDMAGAAAGPDPKSEESATSARKGKKKT